MPGSSLLWMLHSTPAALEQRSRSVASTSAPAPPRSGPPRGTHHARPFAPLPPSVRRNLRTCAGGEGPEATNDAFDSIRRWLAKQTGSRDSMDAPSTLYRMQVNPGDSAMDMDDFGAQNANIRAPDWYNAPRQGPPGGGNGIGMAASRLSQQQQQQLRQGGGGAPTPSPVRRSTPIEEWSAGVADDWDDWEGNPAVADLDDDVEAAELREQVIERRRARRGRRTLVRDEYLRPIVDATGIFNRLAIGEREAEERVFVEAITNQYESRESLTYASILVGVPLVVSLLVGNVVAEPLWSYAATLNPEAFAMSDAQKVEGAHAMHREEVRLRMEASVGQSPALTDDAMVKHLHMEAVEFERDMRARNRHSLLNAVSDSVFGATLFVILVQDSSQRAILFRTVGRVFTGLSDTAKAFIIILITDILLGYHSEEGWTAGLHLLGNRYGWETDHDLLHIFVATVPVLLDSMFKYWIFVGLNKVDPAAAVTLRQMDRH